MPVSLEIDLSVDAPAAPTTGFVVAVGGSAQGSIGVPGDSDFLAVDLVAGETYSFAMVGIGPQPVTDPILRLYGPDGLTLQATDDNGLVNGNALIHYTATGTGRVYLAAAAVSGETGNYAVSASLGPKASFDAQMMAGILDSHSHWSNAPGSGSVLSYGFAETNVQALPGFQPFSEAQEDSMRAVLAQVSELANVSFVEADGDDAVLLYGNYHDPADTAVSIGGLPGDGDFAALAGDVWLNTATPPTDLTLPGSTAFRALLQAVGHSLGLTAPGLHSSAGPAVSYAADALFWQDSRQFTVMSTFAANEVTGPGLPAGIGGAALEPDTLGIADMLALHQIYGQNSTTRLGDDTYGFGSNLGGVYDFDQNFDPMLTIWDAGGFDTLDLWRYSADQLIRLEAGSQSSIGGFANNLGIAHGAVIEAAKGGRGDDSIYGNAVANLVQGNQGADLIFGGLGNDSLYGGSGSDSLYGGGGADVLWGETGLPTIVPSAVFQLVSTTAAGAALAASGAGFFETQSFTLEFIWQQQAYSDPGEMLRFGNLSLQRDAAGQISVLFADAMEDGLLPGALPPALIDGDPHRLSISYNETDGRFCLYLDGVKTFERVFVPNTRGLDSTGGILIADHAAIGDIRIFNYDRSPADIWDWAWAPLPDPINAAGLQHQWAADGMGGLTNAFESQVDLAASGPTQTVAISFQPGFAGNALYGGEGNDVFDVFSPLDSVVELTGQGTDRVIAHSNFALAAGQSIEELVVADGSGGITLTGNTLANSFISSAAHADTLAGGAGDDIYTLYHAGDRVVEAVGRGNDRINAYAHHTLAAGSEVEAIYALGPTARVLTGNTLANSFFSNAACADTLVGGAGNDRYFLNNATDRVIEIANGGTDVIYTTTSYTLAATTLVEDMRVYGAVALKLTGNSAANTLYGGVKADSLLGGAGADKLIGGAGRDLLYGGKDSAADLFIFNSRSESAVGTGRDLVYDFVSARDKIDLHLIDANANVAGNQTFGFGSSTARAYSAWMVKSAGQLVIRLDVTGDARADLEIGLVGLTSAQRTDFLL